MNFSHKSLMFKDTDDHHQTTLRLLIPQLIAVLGVWYTVSNDMNWYEGLKNPFFNPPEWFFGPVWISLYGLMGIASYLVWKQTSPWYSRTMTWFWTQLAVGMLWVLVFFELHSPLLSFILIIPLWILVVICMFAFSLRSKVASALLLPYFVWVSFGVTLNASIYCFNR